MKRIAWIVFGGMLAIGITKIWADQVDGEFGLVDGTDPSKLPLAGGVLTGPVTTSAQILSTWPDGSAPFVVASTTAVANLNAGKNVVKTGDTMTGQLILDYPGTCASEIQFVDGTTLEATNNGTILVKTSATGSLQLANGTRVTSSVGPMVMGTAFTATNTYGDLNDVDMSGDLEVVGNIKTRGTMNAQGIGLTAGYSISDSAYHMMFTALNVPTFANQTNNAFVLATFANYAKAWPFTNQANPTMVWTSAASYDTLSTRWGSITHTGTAADGGSFTLTANSGTIKLAPADGYIIMPVTTCTALRTDKIAGQTALVSNAGIANAFMALCCKNYTLNTWVICDGLGTACCP
jgi:hypothetical protein